MGRPFFITGLPRSRTAWLANLFTHGDSFCWHEGVPRWGGLAGLQRAMRLRTERFVGTADPSLLMCQDRARAMFPGATWILVARRPEHVALSLDAMEVPALACNDNARAVVRLDQEMERLAQRPDVHVFYYEELDELPLLLEMADLVTPGQGIDVDRWEMLRGLQVQVYEPNYLPEMV